MPAGVKMGQSFEERRLWVPSWHPLLDRLPDELRTEAFERLFQACEIARFEPEVKLRYEKDDPADCKSAGFLMQD